MPAEAEAIGVNVDVNGFDANGQTSGTGSHPIADIIRIDGVAGVLFIVSSWFLATTAVLGGEAGGIPDQPGGSRRSSR